MNTRTFESHVEQATLDWFEELGWSVLHGPDIAPSGPQVERKSCLNVVFAERRLRDALLLKLIPDGLYRQSGNDQLKYTT